MNQKITDLIKGRNDGQEILNALDIKESTKHCSKVEKAIRSTIELVDQGMSVSDAAAQAKGDAIPSAIATQSTSSIASNVVPFVSDEVRKTLDGPLIEEGRQVVNGAVPEIAQSAQEAKQDVVGGLGQYAKSMVYKGAQEAFESEEWQQAVIEAIRGGKQ